MYIRAQGVADTMILINPKICFQANVGRVTLGDIADMINALFNRTLSLGKELSAVALQVDKLSMSTLYVLCLTLFSVLMDY